MNIFVVSDDVYECALALDDRRLNKMILETAQLLCTSIVYAPWFNADQYPNLYAPTHSVHPCTQWAMNNPCNWMWLYSLWLSYIIEWEYRKPNNPEHKTFTRLCTPLASIAGRLATLCMERNSVRTPFVNCTEFKHVDNTFEAYRRQLNKKWKVDTINQRFPKWTRRDKPEWYTDDG